jgi:hypothetical protein
LDLFEDTVVLVVYIHIYTSAHVVWNPLIFRREIVNSCWCQFFYWVAYLAVVITLMLVYVS